MSIERGDIQGKCERISKAMAIMEELLTSLNMDKGGEVAESLCTIYDYMMRRLTIANMKSDPSGLDEVLSLLKTLYDAWGEVIGKEGISAGNIQ